MMMMMMRAQLHIAIITINAVIVVISAYLNDGAGRAVAAGPCDVCDGARSLSTGAEARRALITCTADAFGTAADPHKCHYIIVTCGCDTDVISL